VTDSFAVVVWCRLPLVPVIVSVYVWREADDSVLIDSVELPVAGFGVKVTVDPDGWPLRLSETEPLKPLDSVTVTA
jgi:hypothetical protein